MQGLVIRLARAINRVSGRKGKVFAERYFARPLVSEAEVLACLRSIDGRLPNHWGSYPRYIDPFSSASGEACWWDDVSRTVAEAKTELFRLAAARPVPS